MTPDTADKIKYSIASLCNKIEKKLISMGYFMDTLYVYIQEFALFDAALGKVLFDKMDISGRVICISPA